MAVYSKISTSDLVGAVRLDAEFWQPYYLEKEKMVRLSDHVHLGSLVSTFKKGIFYILAKEYADRGVPFYRSSNVGTILPKEENITYITERKHQDEYKTALVRGDLMIVKTGKSGSSVVLKDRCNVSQDVIAVKVKRERINPFYLAVYLNTCFGFSEMNRWFQGQVQPHLSLEDARRILVPLIQVPEQEEIEKLVLNSVQEEDKANQAWSMAQQLLESELGLDKLGFQKPVGYTARFSEIEQSRRLDPEHFYPAFHHLGTHLPGHVSLVPLGTQLSFCQRGKQPVYSRHGLPVVNSKHVRPNKVVLEGNRTTSANPITELQIRNGDILMNGTGRGTIGRVAPYLIDEQAIPDNHVTVLRSPTLDAAYLSFYLNSPAGQLQVEMHQRGTSGQLELYPFDIRKFLVWAAPESFQGKIRNLYDQASASELRSRQLLNKAKSRVEKLIEEAVQS
jgi:type I restriction enzyme M protein